MVSRSQAIASVRQQLMQYVILIIRRILELLYRAQFCCVRAFGYNSADSEPILMKSVALLSTLLGAGPGRFLARSEQ